MAKFYVIKNLSLEVGPQFGYVLSAKAKSGDVSIKIDSDLYNAFDVSAAIGATYNFGKVFVQGRYNQGLTKIIKDAKNQSSVIQFSVGYRF